MKTFPDMQALSIFSFSESEWRMRERAMKKEPMGSRKQEM